MGKAMGAAPVGPPAEQGGIRQGLSALVGVGERDLPLQGTQHRKTVRADRYTILCGSACTYILELSESSGVRQAGQSGVWVACQHVIAMRYRRMIKR